jgi:hypothetical protein
VASLPMPSANPRHNNCWVHHPRCRQPCCFCLLAWCRQPDLIPSIIDMFIPKPAAVVQGQSHDKADITCPISMRMVQSSHARSGALTSPIVQSDQGCHRRRRRCHRSSSPHPPLKSGPSAARVPTRLPMHPRLGPTDGYMESPHSGTSCKAPRIDDGMSLVDPAMMDGSGSPVP